MEAVTILSMLTDAGAVLTSGIGLVWDFITSNVLLIFGVGVGIAGTCVGFFRSLAKGRV